MTASRRLRQIALTIHVATSVGWLGAVATSLALAVAAMTSSEVSVVRSSWIAMEVVGRTALLPLGLLSLASGIAQGFITRWGVLRYYWVVTKLVINLVSVIVLSLYLQTLDHLAALSTASAPLRTLRDPSPIIHASGALSLLLVALVLSVFKPPGLTPRGLRRLRFDSL